MIKFLKNLFKRTYKEETHYERQNKARYHRDKLRMDSSIVYHKRHM